MNKIRLFFDIWKLNRNKKKSLKEIKRLQQMKLDALVKHAYNNSEYYRRVLEENGINEGKLKNVEITKLPVMEKADFTENFDRIITVKDISQNDLRAFDEENSISEKTLPGGYHSVHSSGSTGSPRYFLYDEKAWNEVLLGIIRGALWDMSLWDMIKLFSGGVRILYIAATDGRYGGLMSIEEAVTDLGGDFKSLDINQPLEQWDKVIENYNPNVIIAYPSALKILAGRIEKKEFQLKLKRVITCGEPLSEKLRSYTEKVFEQNIINVYGASESLAIGVETSGKEGMILFDDMNIIEETEDGILLTSLYNYAQPIIRYKLSDELKLRTADHFPMFTRAKSGLFREEDVLWFENADGRNEYLHPLAIEGFCVDGLLDFQFVKTGENSIQMLAQLSSGKRESKVTEKVQEWMGKILEEKRLTNLLFNIRIVDEILPDPRTGKKKLVITKELERELYG